MNIRQGLAISFIFLLFICRSQQVSSVYKISDFLNRINQQDTTFVVNFWATWCKPCIQELPAFDSLMTLTKKNKVKILLVCLDFKEDLEKKVNPFLKKNKIKPECVLLDEMNGNDFINKIDPKWSGAIPATLIIKGKKELFYEKKLRLAELQKSLSDFEK